MSPSVRGVERIAVLMYWGGAIVLVPWIVGLMITQPNRDDTYHRELISLGILLLFAAGAVATGVLCQRQSNQAILAATFTATLVVVAAWFSMLAVHPLAGVLAKGRILLVVVLALLVGLLVWVAVRILHLPTGRWNVPRWAGRVCFLFPALLVPWMVGHLSQAVPVVEAHQMRVVWSGLDLCELAAMLASGWFIRRRSPRLAFSATVLGSLLCCDAWFNVLSASGTDLALGIALAGIELPLAVYSFALAAREVHRWAMPAGRAGIAEGPATFEYTGRTASNRQPLTVDS